jgi:undecaprenyl-diphosphatase
MNQIIQLDKAIFQLINQRWHNHLFDTLMPIIRNSQTWIPLYFFLLLICLFNFDKNKWQWILFAALTPILTNFISSDLIKENISRLRPCNDPSMADSMRFLLNYRPQSSSFTSSHATNHFGMATFFFLTLKDYIGKWGWLFFCWAGIIVYAQIYVGVHYPLDILAGGLMGTIVGYASATLFNRRYGSTKN